MIWLAALLLQADSKTELLRLEEKFRAVKTISAKFSSTWSTEGFGGTQRSETAGEIRLANGNKARVSVKVTNGGSVWDYLMISDGEKMWGTGGSPDRRDTRRKPADHLLGPRLSVLLLRGGADSSHAHFWLTLDPECDFSNIGGDLPKDDFAFKELEEKGEQWCIAYSSGKPSLQAEKKIWYDPKTLNLLRRESVSVKIFDPETRSVSTWRDVYEGFVYDAPLAPELFKVPK